MWISHIFVTIIGGIILHGKLQSEWFILIGLQAEYPASFKVMNKTWQPIWKITKGKCCNSLIFLLFSKSRRCDCFLQGRLINVQNIWTKISGNMRLQRLFWNKLKEKPGCKSVFYNTRLKTYASTAVKRRKNGQTCWCFHDNVI